MQKHTFIAYHYKTSQADDNITAIAKTTVTPLT
ncbi:hypothetical protein NIES37_54620 [Tolypothrix tenuis PCC 7101]|uniref:Uncharacterized protein n=1 Tax=Tolypothrix tenuis PCC 7101 TaxID=231146 RepID=A0A1Z4N724_9CYAN|nr:hypothetical protein NIES37_54620 [Tolypothrix tenuis PCC 7101]BAZ74615.1 hypothetical protein NIES50_31930 [Aulosira laxa NIES-50]